MYSTGSTNVYIHSRNVAYLSFLFAKYMEKRLKISIDYEILTVGAMFHDFFLYDWHDKYRSGSQDYMDLDIQKLQAKMQKNFII